MCSDRRFGHITQLIAATTLVMCTLVSLAQAKSASEFDWSAYTEAIEAQMWDEAWELIQGADGTTDTQIFGERGMLLGSGNLSTGIHRCEAVLQFELAIEHGAIWVIGLLNSLYAGDWMSIASIEGSRTALEHLSGRVWDYRDDNHVFFVFDDKRVARESAPYLFLSANLGYDLAKRRIKSRSKKYPDIYGVEYENTEIPWGEYRKVFCPVRTYDPE